MELLILNRDLETVKWHEPETSKGERCGRVRHGGSRHVATGPGAAHAGRDRGRGGADGGRAGAAGRREARAVSRAGRAGHRERFADDVGLLSGRSGGGLDAGGPRRRPPPVPRRVRSRSPSAVRDRDRTRRRPAAGSARTTTATAQARYWTEVRGAP